MVRTAQMRDCSRCEARTVHNRVRRDGKPGILHLCRECTDVADELGGKYRLAK